MEKDHRFGIEIQWSWITLILSMTSSILCFVGDTFLARPSISSHLRLRSAADSLTHGIVGACCWAAVITTEDNFRHLSTWGRILLAGFVASIIDIDHFLSARSLSLKVKYLMIF